MNNESTIHVKKIADRKVSTRRAYETLANAIIVEACKDYLRDLKVMKKARSSEKRSKAADDARSIERFLRSQWYRELTKVDPEYLIEQIRKMV